MKKPAKQAKIKPSAKPPARKLAPLVAPPAAALLPPSSSMTSAVPLMLDQYMAHPGYGLTADTVRRAFASAELGMMSMQCDMFDDIVERDAHLRSLCEARIEAVAGKSWMVQAGGDAEVDVAAAKALETALRAVPDFGLVLEHLLSATLYGYAAAEIEWRQVGGMVVPVWFACTPHRRFVFDIATDEMRVLTNKDMVAGESLTPGRWIVARRQNRKTARAGLLRTATWWSWLKHVSLRDWQIFSARFGIPFILGRYEFGADEPTIAKVKEAIRSFGQGGGAALPLGVEIDIKEPASASGSEGVHKAFVDLCNSEMSKLVLGGTLTTSEGSSGSYNLGSVHADKEFAKNMGDAERLSHTIALHLGVPFTQWNPQFNGARPPRLRMRIVREQNPEARMRIASIFANELGGTLDEDQFRDEFDLKRPTGGVLKGTKNGAAPPPPTAA